ncbi:metallophosphoesterase [Endozoicomonas sp. Mp262]|uniref:metallophosphoesterase n=1 Tax=Endozoicomonas sp. Mp262 TaxID=2919499 RepID=UPI0021D7DD11
MNKKIIHFPMNFNLFFSARRYATTFLLMICCLSLQAETIVSCPRGMQYQSATCYSVCPENYDQEGVYCRAQCRDGYSYNNLTSQCSKGFFGAFYTPDRKQRSIAYPSTCESTSFTRAVDTRADPEVFTLLIASDTQLPWGPPGRRSSADSELVFGKKSNHQQVEAMNAIQQVAHTHGGTNITGQWPNTSYVTRGGGAVTKPLGLILNGDLTAYWHDWQVDLYKQYYHTAATDEPGVANLKLKLFPGLGNHDYANNLNRGGQGCWWNRNLEYMALGYNGCAKNATHYIKTMVSCNGVPNFESNRVTSFDEGSLAYSFDIGRYHFIQLNNHPAYTASEIGITDAFEWLRRDLDSASRAGKYIVINFHDYGEHMGIYNPQFVNLMASNTKNVIAVFVGHVHQVWGHTYTVPRTNIPVFRSGAAEYNTFLLVQFGKDYMNVGVVSSLLGTPRFLNHSSQRNLKTWEYSDILN